MRGTEQIETERKSKGIIGGIRKHLGGVWAKLQREQRDTFSVNKE